MCVSLSLVSFVFPSDRQHRRCITKDLVALIERFGKAEELPFENEFIAPQIEIDRQQSRGVTALIQLLRVVEQLQHAGRDMLTGTPAS